MFTELRDWCEERKLRLVDVDLRWVSFTVIENYSAISSMPLPLANDGESKIIDRQLVFLRK